MNKLFPLLAALFLIACGSEPPAKEPTSEAVQVGDTYETDVLTHPDWSHDATIYEVNIRQHTPEGTFKAFEADIPRLNEMGIEIMWLMPIHPIGEVNRKGGLGSYYAVKDYTAVNPDYGTMEDFKSLVTTAHSYGMRVMIDWVANHTAFDNVWTKDHMDYYMLDSLDQLQPPLGTDWWDVAQLDWKGEQKNEAMWNAMTESMAFWLTEANIDGFRCDVADFVPVEFWDQARQALEKVNPQVFMLAEAENPPHHERAFDMSYSWEFMHIMNEIAKGVRLLSAIDDYMAKEDTYFVESAYRMMFTTNHDENSWNGTVFDRYGEGHLAYATLAFTINGMPLIYSGQEAGNNEALEFFEKDTVKWGEYIYQDFYTKLMKLNRENEALWNGHFGGDFIKLPTTADDKIYAFMRKKEEHEVITIVNLSEEPTTVELVEALGSEYRSIFNNQMLSVFTNGELKLDKFGYQVFVKE
ncbi:MAG: alpha-amylase family glycosyl hydrolase [Flavobacteriales bacterium]|nr:alpha-amylase family glycosyl hydrolase [Flavobacteriales bacterium]